MANCGVKRDLESSNVHFQNSVRSAFAKISIEVLHSSSCNRVFRTEFILCVRLVRATISGAETNPDSQRMCIKMICLPSALQRRVENAKTEMYTGTGT